MAWRLSLVLSIYKSSSHVPEVDPDVSDIDDPLLAELILEMRRALAWMEAREEEERREEIREAFRPPVIRRLQLGSPLDIIVGLGPEALFVGISGGVGWAALKVFAKMLREPEQIGAWLPALAASWHRKHEERLIAKQQRRITEVRGQLLEAELARIVQQSIDNSGPLLTPEILTVEGVEEPSEDVLD
jgi:hypothetical protein